MKKKTAKRTTTRKSTRNTSHRSSEHILLLPFSFRRIILVTTAIALFLGVVILFNKDQVTQSVAGIQITRGLFAQATVKLPKVEGATSYNVYYKKTSAREYTNSAREIPVSSTTYTISYLKKGEDYLYKIAAVNTDGAEFWWTDDKFLKDIVPME